MDTPLSHPLHFWDQRMKKKGGRRRREGEKEEENRE